MAVEIGAAAATTRLTSLKRDARRRRPPVYVTVAILSVAIALAGFWPKYFGPLLAGTLQTDTMIHIHAVVFLGWLVIVGVQAWFAASGRIALHMRVGHYAMYWGVLVIVVGVVTAFTVFGDRIAAGNVEEARNRLFVPLTDLMVFVPFFAAAWLFRHKTEMHKRLIIVATTILLIAAVHRIPFLGGRPPPVPQLLAVWLAPIYIGMIHDFIRTRRVSLVYLLGIGAVLFLKFGRMGLYSSQGWQDLSTWFATLYDVRL
jgi:hypothetical protein